MPPQVFYRSNPAREAFVEMCESSYVQKMTFDSYLYKTGAPALGLDETDDARAVGCSRALQHLGQGWCRRRGLRAALPTISRSWPAALVKLVASPVPPSRSILTLPSPTVAPHSAVVPGNPLDDVKLLVDTVGSLLRANALRSKDSKSVNVSFGSKSNEEKVTMASA